MYLNDPYKICTCNFFKHKFTFKVEINNGAINGNAIAISRQLISIV